MGVLKSTAYWCRSDKWPLLTGWTSFPELVPLLSPVGLEPFFGEEALERSGFSNSPDLSPGVERLVPVFVGFWTPSLWPHG